MVTPHGVFSAEGFLCSNCNYIKDGVVVGPLYLWFWLAKQWIKRAFLRLQLRIVKNQRFPGLWQHYWGLKDYLGIREALVWGFIKKMPKTDTLDALENEMRHSLNML